MKIMIFILCAVLSSVTAFAGNEPSPDHNSTLRLTGELPTWRMAFGGAGLDHHLKDVMDAKAEIAKDKKTKYWRGFKAWLSVGLAVGIPYLNGAGILGKPSIAGSGGALEGGDELGNATIASLQVIQTSLVVGSAGYSAQEMRSSGSFYDFSGDLSFSNGRYAHRQQLKEAKRAAEAAVLAILNQELNQTQSGQDFIKQYGHLKNVTINLKDGFVSEIETLNGIKLRTLRNQKADIDEITLHPVGAGPDVILDLDVNSITRPAENGNANRGEVK